MAGEPDLCLLVGDRDRLLRVGEAEASFLVGEVNYPEDLLRLGEVDLVGLLLRRFGDVDLLGDVATF